MLHIKSMASIVEIIIKKLKLQENWYQNMTNELDKHC